MKQPNYFTIIFLLLSLSLFTFWFIYNPVEDFAASIPGQDNRPDKNSASFEVINIGEDFKKFSNKKSDLTGKWERFRGLNFDNINTEKIPLINNFGNKEVKILWKVNLGEGHAAPAIYNGNVFLIDYDETQKADMLKCFSLESGEELWRRWYKIHIKRNHGMSRTIPAVSEKYIVTIGPRGHVMCLNSQNGDFLWGLDIEKKYETEIPFWYTGQCPLIDNGTAIIAPGGSSLMIAVDCASGEIVWEAPNPDNWKMSHSSIMPMFFEGKKMYVYAAVGGICGISAEAEDKGKLLWKTAEFTPNVVAPSPIVFPDGKIFMTAGYGAGSVLFQLKKKNDEFSVEILQKYKTKEGIASEQQTPLVFNNHIFSILPKDAGSSRNQFVCCKYDNCQNILWASGKSHRFGLGPYIIADNKFYILSDDGTLTIAKLSSSHFIFLDKSKIFDGQDAWGPLAIADGRLLMRDSKQMFCIDLRAGK